jgi:transcriptional regulator with XRE-family HTH domain
MTVVNEPGQKSLRQIARELGVSVSYLSQVIHGKRPASPKVAEVLSSLHLGVKQSKIAGLYSKTAKSESILMVGGNGLEPMTSAMRGQGLVLRGQGFGLRKIHLSHFIHNVPPKAAGFYL